MSREKTFSAQKVFCFAQPSPHPSRWGRLDINQEKRPLPSFSVKKLARNAFGRYLCSVNQTQTTMSKKAFRIIESLRFLNDDPEDWGLMPRVKSTRHTLGTVEDIDTCGHIAYLFVTADQVNYYYGLRGMRPSKVLSLSEPIHRDAVAVLIWTLD